MKKFICPFNKIVISEKNQIGNYIRFKSKSKNIDKDELRFLIYAETFGDITSKKNFSKYYLDMTYSLPMFKEEFGMSYKTTQFLINYHGIQARGSKEATKCGAIRAKITNLERYGVDQTFKVKEFDDKRKATYMEKYGVENPFTGGTCLKNLDDLYIKKYGISHREYKSRKSSEVWKNKPVEEREKWLNDTILKDNGKVNGFKNSKRISKPEKLIGMLLMSEGFNITTQYKVGRYPFDFKLNDYNMLIEFNGDVFHANPNIYLPDDIIPILKKTAQEIWNKDLTKMSLAKSKGYDTVVIWESEIKNKTEQEIIEIIYEKISNIKN
jgi:very-short-patch-repair endonuclease